MVAVWHAIERGYRRHLRSHIYSKRVSRLHGHSSPRARASKLIACGFREKPISAGIIHREHAEMIHHEAQEADKAVEQ